ncbi:MAG TPA: TrkA family potassium uptake protein [Spirochaetia bacterium]|nr:TrkA family potassium uptake protein [Spirochaetales bacterium]HRY81721.1 TrkA family potassium uptake protein [Spirochaetia bacterium]HRZ87961.1 TrkA family potassium uptake protein [Spirochaetia bacterium]
MKALIIGGGTSIYFLCRNLASRGFRVAVIDRDPEVCGRLSRFLPVEVVCADGSDAGVLEEAGARKAELVLAVTGNDADNLVACQLASMEFGVPRTAALANDPENAEAFQDLGVPSFSIAEVVGSLIEQRASLREITNVLPAGGGKVIVTELVLQENSPVAGKLLKEVALPENSLVAILIRGEETIVPRGGNDLRAGDRLVLVTLPDNHGPAIRAVTGERSGTGGGV